MVCKEKKSYKLFLKEKIIIHLNVKKVYIIHYENIF
jgi:hypothetical protein